jgi:hypothetical protein
VSLNGVWMSEDPEQFRAGDANLSRYVSNTPTSFIDPEGRWQKRPKTSPPWVSHPAAVASSGNMPVFLPPDTSGAPHGLPSAPNDSWRPWWFFFGSPYDHKLRGFGCGGMAAFRVMGDDGRINNPGSVLRLPGVKAYSDFQEALDALRQMELSGQRGALIAVQQSQKNGFVYSGTMTRIKGPQQGVDACTIGAPAFGTGNFAILLGTDKVWYWEYANKGWRSRDDGTAVIRHTPTLPGIFSDTLYYVIPADQTLTPSPIPPANTPSPAPEWPY